MSSVLDVPSLVHPTIAIVGLPEALRPIPPAPPEPDDLADWLDRQAAHYRVGGTDASEMAALMFEERAREARYLSATTAAEFEARRALQDEWAMVATMTPEFQF